MSDSPATPSSPDSPRPSGGLLVLLFAFLAAAFPASNSDLFLRLAAGRDVLAGVHTFGVDRYSWLTDGVYWANPAWLSDVFFYLGYTTLGGAALVAIKATLVALTAWLLLRSGRDGGANWVSQVAVILFVLAAGPRLMLQPVVVSLLLLAAFLRLLQADRGKVALPLLVALWANLDAYYFLGPVVVVLWRIGQSIPGNDTPPEKRLSWLAVGLCVFAVVLNPHHVRVTDDPVLELSRAARAAFGDDPRFADLFATPWSPTLFGVPGHVNLAGYAFVTLLALAAAAFVVDPTARRDGRLPLAIAFAAWACVSARLIPFFAVVAAFVAIRSFGRILSDKSDTTPARGLVGLAAVALVAMAWPGLLVGTQRTDRAVGFEVREDTSLRDACLALLDDRPDRVWTRHPDAAHYLAWFAPGIKGGIDLRLPLFARRAEEERRLAARIDPSLTGRLSAALTDDPPDFALVSDPDVRRLAPAIREAVTGGAYKPVGIFGRTLLLSRRAAFDADGFATYVVPEAGPDRVPVPLPWYLRLLERPEPSPPGASAAAVVLRMFDDLAPRDFAEQRRAVVARSVSMLVGVSASPHSLATFTGAMTRLALPGMFQPDGPRRDPALPLLALRQARRGLAERPMDATGWFLLGRSYLALSRSTHEADPAEAMPPLVMLRHVQAATALKLSLVRDEANPATHEALAVLFADRGYYDASLTHRLRQIELLRKIGPAGSDAIAFAERIDALAADADRLERAVQDAQSRYAVRTDALTDDPLARARFALSQGLAAKALSVLRDSKVELFGAAGARLYLELLLATGGAEEARVHLSQPELHDAPDLLGDYDMAGGYSLPAYDWFDACQAAALGRYADADAALDRVGARQAKRVASMPVIPPAELVAAVTADLGLRASGAALAGGLARTHAINVVRLEATRAALRGQAADVSVVRAMLLSERGEVGRAKATAESALKVYESLGGSVGASPGEATARRLAGR